MSAQRVTSSRAANPCLAYASENTSLSRTERGFAEIQPGFAMGLYITSLVAGTISTVMAGFIPAIHVWTAAEKKDVDARDKPGHDVERFAFRH